MMLISVLGVIGVVVIACVSGGGQFAEGRRGGLYRRARRNVLFVQAGETRGVRDKIIARRNTENCPN